MSDDVIFFKHSPQLIIFGVHNLQTFKHNALVNELLLMLLNSITGSDENYCRSVKTTKFWTKNLYECKGYNSRQFITEIPDKGWTKNSINRLLVKFEQSSGVRAAADAVHVAYTDENIDTHESLLLSQEGKPHSHGTVREFSREAGGSIDHQSRVSSCWSKVCSTADWSAQHERIIFGMQFETR